MELGLFFLQSSNVSQIKTYVNEEDGMLHFIDSVGADTVLNFSKGIDGFTDMFVYSNIAGQSISMPTQKYTVPEEYYGKKAFIFYSVSYDAGAQSGSNSLSTSGLLIETKHIDRSHTSSTVSAPYGTVKLYEGTLQEGTIVAKCSGWDRKLMALVIIVI